MTRAREDLDLVERALDSITGHGRHLPLRELLEQFTVAARGHQLLVVQPKLMALVYEANGKSGCYTGFTQGRSKC